MSVYIRRFEFDPGEDVLLEIESVNILDLEPPAAISGVGTGTACLVGEFENGPFAASSGTTSERGVFEVTSATDMRNRAGELGYTYDGVRGENPSARIRYSDSAVVGEKWNGNGFVHLNGKKFKRLILCRVDTSVGAVEFSRLAYVSGTGEVTYNLEPGQTLVFEADGGGDDTATFSAAVAVLTGSGAAFGSIVAGDTVTLGYDDAENFTVTFLTDDTTIAAVVARINTAAGFTFASDNGSGQLRLTGRQRGTGGAVRVVSGTAVTNLGHTTGTTAGTGNVANIDKVTVAEVTTLVEAANASVTFEIAADGSARLTNIGTPLTGTLEVKSSSTAVAFGFDNDEHTAASGDAGTIPAGTRVRVPSGQQFVTMQDLAVDADDAGPYSVKIRHALDDGTGTSAIAGAVDEVEQSPTIGAFSVVNPLPITACLTETQIDARYVEAIAATINISNVSREITHMWSARQSNAVRRALRANAIEASSVGCFGRKCVIRPPLGTTRGVAQSDAEPGVGAYRHQRTWYTFPGVRTYIPRIAERGVGGSTGFTADGFVDTGADGFLVSVCTQLPPEENPGQLTSFTGAIVSLESSPNAQDFDMTDYINFKAKGIVAPRMDEGVAIFQSGITSVDPRTSPSLVNISRRQMADYIQDSLARRAKGFGKKLSTKKRRDAFVGEVRAWLSGLVSGGRIEGFTIDLKANTPRTLGRGMFRVVINVRTLSSLDSIVLETIVGEQVTLSEAA